MQEDCRIFRAVYLSYYPGQGIALRGIGLAFVASLAWTACFEKNLLLNRPVPRVNRFPRLHFVPHVDGFDPLTGYIVEIKPHPQLAETTLDLVNEILDLILVATMFDDIKVPQDKFWVGEVFVLSWLPASPWKTCFRGLHEIMIVGMEPAVFRWMILTHLELTAVQVQGSSVFLYFVAHNSDQVACFTVSVSEAPEA